MDATLYGAENASDVRSNVVQSSRGKRARKLSTTATFSSPSRRYADDVRIVVQLESLSSLQTDTSLSQSRQTQSGGYGGVVWSGERREMRHESTIDIEGYRFR
ncbi:hypothetical protein HPB50_016065 [Hyalomma asiaticum]|uniref:Uncharacterized protein n=1 Tax=Hyalomma asiaticum TaxID=266040 RepID=A0ACB7SED1_HYAAI|nr:hypothetical protein HPB50_016065 [Hyalomma asiaticum]